MACSAHIAPASCVHLLCEQSYNVCACRLKSDSCLSSVLGSLGSDKSLEVRQRMAERERDRETERERERERESFDDCYCFGVPEFSTTWLLVPSLCPHLRSLLSMCLLPLSLLSVVCCLLSVVDFPCVARLLSIVAVGCSHNVQVAPSRRSGKGGRSICVSSRVQIPRRCPTGSPTHRLLDCSVITQSIRIHHGPSCVCKRFLRPSRCWCRLQLQMMSPAAAAWSAASQDGRRRHCRPGRLGRRAC